MAKSKQLNINYPTLLGYMNKLSIKVYDISQVHCQFSVDEIDHWQGASMRVFHGHLDDSDTSGSDPIPVALKNPVVTINEKTLDSKVFEVLNRAPNKPYLGKPVIKLTVIFT